MPWKCAAVAGDTCPPHRHRRRAARRLARRQPRSRRTQRPGSPTLSPPGRTCRPGPSASRHRPRTVLRRPSPVPRHLPLVFRTPTRIYGRLARARSVDVLTMGSGGSRQKTVDATQAQCDAPLTSRWCPIDHTIPPSSGRGVGGWQRRGLVDGVAGPLWSSFCWLNAGRQEGRWRQRARGRGFSPIVGAGMPRRFPPPCPGSAVMPHWRILAADTAGSRTTP